MVWRRKQPVPRIIAIAGGKGGVGKSVVSANLAVALARLGQRAVLIDADLGAANLHTMLGLVNPSAGLAEFLDHKVEGLEALRTQVLVPTLSLVSGTSRPGAANLKKAQKLRLLNAIARLDADCVVVDVGAGASYNVVDLVAAADHKLLVMTPQLPSLHNAYALLKGCVHRVARRLALDDVQQKLVDAALGHETRARTMGQLLGVLRPLDGELADRITGTLLHFGVAIIANQIEQAADAAALSRMSPLIYDHLMTPAPVIAQLRRSPDLAGGLRAGVGTLAQRGPDALAFRKLAQVLVMTDLDQLRGVDRVASQSTQPLWVQRDAQIAEDELELGVGSTP
ncbi:MAG TPA: P-loop NTPase [Kofleriaceae bacterium]